MNMEAKVMGIGEFRKTLSARVEAAHFEHQPTVIRHDKRDEPRAALIPYEWLLEICEAKGIPVPDRTD